MKKVILLLLISANLQAQTIELDSISVGGVKFRAAADFECMIWNKRTSSVALQWKLKVYGRDSSVIMQKPIEQVADNSSFVYQDGSVTQPSDIVYMDSTIMMYKVGEVVVVPEYKFYEHVAENGAGGATIYDMIRTAGLRRKHIFKL